MLSLFLKETYLSNVQAFQLLYVSAVSNLLKSKGFWFFFLNAQG